MQKEITVALSVLADDHISIWPFNSAPFFLAEQFSQKNIRSIAYVPEKLRVMNMLSTYYDTQAIKIEQGDGSVVVGVI